MSNAGEFAKMLDGQRHDEDWPRMEWQEQPANHIEDGARKIVIPHLEVAFVFDANGVLIGAVNYKQSGHRPRVNREQPS